MFALVLWTTLQFLFKKKPLGLHWNHQEQCTRIIYKPPPHPSPLLPYVWKSIYFSKHGRVCDPVKILQIVPVNHPRVIRKEASPSCSSKCYSSSGQCLLAAERSPGTTWTWWTVPWRNGLLCLLEVQKQMSSFAFLLLGFSNQLCVLKTSWSQYENFQFNLFLCHCHKFFHRSTQK